MNESKKYDLAQIMQIIENREIPQELIDDICNVKYKNREFLIMRILVLRSYKELMEDMLEIGWEPVVQAPAIGDILEATIIEMSKAISIGEEKIRGSIQMERK